MNRHCERLITILSQPIKSRRIDDILLLTDWLRDTIPCLKTLEPDIVHEVVRLGSYKKCVRDEVVVRPGQKDDGIYIILGGVASVYVKSKHRDFASEVSAINEELSASDLVTTTVDDDGSTKASDECDGEAKVSRPQSTPGERKPGAAVVRTTSMNNKSGQDEVSREKMGKLVARFSVGKCVGGAAQSPDDSFRNATIVSDDNVHLLHLNQQAYDLTIKPSRERELIFRRKFVELHPAFVCCSTKTKQLLETILTKQFYPSGQSIVRQGDQYAGLVFILRGQANVVVEPDKHRTQYSSLLDVPTNQAEETQHTETQDKVRVAKKSRKLDTSSNRPTVSLEPNRVRRRCSYTTAEKRLRSRRLDVCCVERGEILGDVELVAGLDTYCQTVTATAPVDAYALSVRGIERIGSKAFSGSMNVLRTEVETKLTGRIERLRDRAPALFPRVVERMRLRDEERPVDLPPLLVTTKSLPTSEELFQHLLKSFVENRSALCQPYVPGAVFYRDMMRTKATQRRSAPETLKRAGVRGRVLLAPMKPLTKRAIKIALKRQEEELDKVEETARLHEMRYMDEERTRAECERVKMDYRLDTRTPPLTEKALMSLQQVLLNKIRHNSTQNGSPPSSFETQLDGVQSRPKVSTTTDPFTILLQSTKTVTTLQAIKPNDPEDPEKATLPIESGITHSSRTSDGIVRPIPPTTSAIENETSLLNTREKVQNQETMTEHRKPENDIKLTSVQTAETTGQESNASENGKYYIKPLNHREISAETEDNGLNKKSTSTKMAAAEPDKIGLQLERTMTLLSELERTKTLLSELDRQSEPADLQTDVEGPRGTLREVHSARAELNVPPRAELNLPPRRDPASMKKQLMQTEARRMKEAVVLTIAKELCEERARNRLNRDLVSAENALYDSPSYRDWETSDRSLRYLEERIARFYMETEKERPGQTTKPPVLPKLRRFEPTDDSPKHAAPGGKVYVKRRACDVQKAKGAAVKNHDHVRYHLLPSIPNYDQLRTSKMVMFQMLDDARQQWIDEQ